MTEIGIITNPHSKLNRQDPSRVKLLSFLLGKSGRMEVTQSIDDLSLVAKEFKRANISILAISGGDGTISQTISAFIREYGTENPLPKIAILRGGTMNVLASNLGIYGTPENVLFRLIHYLSSGQAFQIKKFKTLKLGELHGFLFGNGLVGSFLSEFYKNKTGPLGSVLLILKLYGSLVSRDKKFFKEIMKTFHYQVENFISPKEREFFGVSILCSTIPRMPLGIRFFPQLENKTPASFFTCHEFQMSAEEFARKLPMIIFYDFEKKHDKIYTCNLDKMLIRSEGDPLFTLDGEIYQVSEKKLTLELGREIEFIII